MPSRMAADEVGRRVVSARHQYLGTCMFDIGGEMFGRYDIIVI